MNTSGPAPATSAHHAILVADDDPDVRGLLASFLSGIRPVIEACDGSEAVALARRHHPSLIVCDSEMPAMRARDVIATLRIDPELAQIPVIVTSGYPEADVTDNASRPTAFLAKPFTIVELVDLVERTLGSSA